MLLLVSTDASAASNAKDGEMRPLQSLAQMSGVEPIRARVMTTTGYQINIAYAMPEARIRPVEGDDRDVFGEDAEIVTVGNAPLAGAPGYPVLPFVPVTVILPPDTTLDRVDVTPGAATALAGRHVIKQGQKNFPLSSVEPHPATPKDEKVYSSDEPWPGKTFEVVGVQKKRGVSELLLNLYPVQYRPKSGEIACIQAVSLTVTVKPVVPSKTGIRYRQDPDGLLLLRADNPEALSAYVEKASPGTEPKPMEVAAAAEGGADTGGVMANALPTGSFQYVIITSRALRDATTDYTIRNLVAHRQAQGVTATNMAVEDIYANYSGVDNPEKIRNFIKDAYNIWSTDYVLLGGDTNIVPLRLLSNPDFTNAQIPSDVYYQCLDGPMNGNGNEYWGEPDDGEAGADIDMLADVYIGRASAKNAGEMANFVFKTLAYENDSDFASYKTTALMVGCWLGWGNGISEYGGPMMEEIRLGSSSNSYTTVGFASGQYFTADTMYEPGNPVEESTILPKINSNHYSMFNHLGHGWYSATMGLNAMHLDKLSNTKFAFIYSQCCYAGGFDTECLAENLTRSSRTGFFAAVMNSRAGVGSRDSTDGASQLFNRYFWDGYFGAKKIRTLGALNANAHESALPRMGVIGAGGGTLRWCFQQSNLFGDPMTRFPEVINRNIRFDKPEYFCGNWATVTMTSTGLIGRTTQTVAVATSGGDSESLVLYPDAPGSSTFTNRMWIDYGASSPGNGKIEGVHGTELTVSSFVPGEGMSVTGRAMINLDLQIAITTPPLTLPMQTNAISIAGVNNGNVSAAMSVSNEATGAWAAFVATTNTWVAPAVSLTNGANKIWIFGTNAYGRSGSNFVLITRVGPTGVTNYVSPSGAHVWPYTSWANAATTIVAAADAAYNNNVVMVADGTYSGMEVVLVRPIRLMSQNGAARTVLDGGSNGRCLQVLGNALVQGFTLTHGAADLGAGAYMQAGTLKDCVVSSNSASQHGGGVYLYYGGSVQNCTIANNSAVDRGGGVYILTAGTVAGCVLTGNSAGSSGGGVLCYGGGVVTGSVISANSASIGGGVSCEDGGKVSNCTISYNTATGSGGGVSLFTSGTVNNSLICGNQSGYSGGGAYLSGSVILENCSVLANEAAGSGGGIYNVSGSGWVRNCVIYFNEAVSGDNLAGGASSRYYYCCTTPSPTGLGHVTNSPQVVGIHNGHLLTNSPCIDKGTNVWATGVDLDGETRIIGARVDIGCDEYAAGSITGALSAVIADGVRTAVTGYTLELMSDSQGRANKIVWDFGDGVIVTNQTVTSHAWSSGGDYTVRLSAFNNSYPGGVSTTTVVHVLSGVTNYVSPAGGHVAPFTSWATAATNIQTAIDACPNGGVVLVTNGTYGTGQYFKDGSTNRIGIYKPVRVVSVNGPAVTTITGDGNWSTNPIRCVYLTPGAELSGFTLSHGSTGANGSFIVNGGGGAFFDSGGLLSDCVITACQGYWGGGTFLYYGGSMERCTIYANKSYYGGCGVYCYYGGKVESCVIRNNTGGVWGQQPALICQYGGEVNNCTVIHNPLGISCSYSIWGAQIKVRNTISYYNTGANWDTAGTGITYAACCTTPLLAGAGNMTNDPQVTVLGRLLSTSPCIDAGVSSGAPALDMDGEARWDHPGHANVFSIVDIGADEYVDGDANGLPDWWELMYFGATNQSGTADDDLDGLNNLAEYINGTDPRTADTDGDGMPDGWENTYGLNPRDANGDGDADGDGFRDFAEYIADTVPTNSTSRLTILDSTVTGGQLVIRWSGVTGRLYTVILSAGNLASWTNAADFVDVPGTGGVMCHTNGMAPASLRFYRIKVRKP
jgi:hypothetical protein